METKAFTDIEYKTAPEGRFVARLCTWDTPDLTGDVLRRGTFAESTARWLRKHQKIPVIFNHRWEDVEQHVGEIDPVDLHETARGLEVTGQFYLTEPTALKVFKQLERRALSEWSMGFSIQQSRPLGRGGREITQAHLIECGPCLKGMGETETLAVKAAAPAPLAERRRRLADLELRPHRQHLDLLTRHIRLDRLRPTR